MLKKYSFSPSNKPDIHDVMQVYNDRIVMSVTFITPRDEDTLSDVSVRAFLSNTDTESKNSLFTTTVKSFFIPKYEISHITTSTSDNSYCIDIHLRNGHTIDFFFYTNAELQEASAFLFSWVMNNRYFTFLAN